MSAKRIAVMVDQMYQVLEVWYPYYRLKEAGFAVDLVAGEAGKEYPSKEGYPCVSDRAAGGLKAADYACMVVPGGFAPDFMRRSEDVIRFANDMANAGKIIAAICPTVHEPLVAPIQFDFDMDNRTAHLVVGDGVVETVTETMRGIDPPEPYRVIVKIPNGFEYTGPDESAETAKATKIVSNGAVKLDLTDSHSSLAWVRHGNSVDTGAHPVGA